MLGLSDFFNKGLRFSFGICDLDQVGQLIIEWLSASSAFSFGSVLPLSLHRVTFGDGARLRNEAVDFRSVAKSQLPYIPEKGCEFGHTLLCQCGFFGRPAGTCLVDEVTHQQVLMKSLTPGIVERCVTKSRLALKTKFLNTLLRLNPTSEQVEVRSISVYGATDEAGIILLVALQHRNPPQVHCSATGDWTARSQSSPCLTIAVEALTIPLQLARQRSGYTEAKQARR